MLYKVVLRLADIDFRSPDARRLFDDIDQDVLLESEGPLSLATLYADTPGELLQAALAFAAMLRTSGHGATVAGVHDELASTPMIAERVNVGPEAVRLWVRGQRRGLDFPPPRQILGSGTKPQLLFAWRDVLAWTRTNMGIDVEPGVSYLTEQQVHELNYQLDMPVSSTTELLRGVMNMNSARMVYFADHFDWALRILPPGIGDTVEGHRGWTDIQVHTLSDVQLGPDQVEHGF